MFLSQLLFSSEISTVSEGDIPALACRASVRINMVYKYIYTPVYKIHIHNYNGNKGKRQIKYIIGLLANYLLERSWNSSPHLLDMHL